MPYFYTLDDNKDLIPTNDPSVWSRFLIYERDKCIVRQDSVGEYTISTVFVGWGGGGWGTGNPRIFETLITGPEDDVFFLWGSWEEASAGHQALVAGLQKGES